jgi:rhodanese-related sulfurtransferase
MFKLSLALLSIFALALIMGCGTPATKFDTGAQSKMKVVNVLSKELYDDAHIKGSIQIDFEKVAEAAAAWNKNDTVVFYCLNPMCTASFEAARTLGKMGFTNVMAYEGGIAEWYRLSKSDAGYQIEGPAQETYLKEEVTMKTAPASDVKVVSAEQLRTMMKDAGLL